MDVSATHIAYDHGDHINIVNIDPQTARSSDEPVSAEDLAVGGDRDATLAAAGFRRVGEWRRENGLESAPLERTR
ncbi:hypothetical protein ACQEU5_23550 [Marinactinospora thermotolerans]|uniref:Uncharacterized protein n=1 Tax=Marinactinospora thermotolerans DSM 45154 TaxID=1122192 RepID=A0A1T4K5D9_9ACTN|nr:hypothetical protein [Marinactinospora thermotolerans]SJZ37631.1 hypothetical protein SAMN02745673_00174 [Marinactinospora thermotolerans DSM 45154]